VRETLVYKYGNAVDQRGQRHKARRFEDAGDDQRFVAVADDGADAFEARQFFGCALCVASGDDDSGVGILAMDAADEGTGAAVGIGGDTAGIHDDDAGGREICCRLQAPMAQPCRDRLSIGAAGTASKVLDVIFCHSV
jgi:hypothetical protein